MASFPEVNQPGGEADHSLACSVEVKMGEATASVPCITSCHALFYLDLDLDPLSLTLELIS